MEPGDIGGTIDDHVIDDDATDSKNSNCVEMFGTQ